MNLSGVDVLVTGAGGFIGSHLVERLHAEGARVRALVHYRALGGAGWLDDTPIRQEVEVVAGDLTDDDTVREAVRSREIVFHLGALIAIPYSYGAPRSYVRTNLEGSLNVFQAAREAGVRRIIHTSTSEVYGTARQVPITEDHPLQGQSPYAASKIAADKMAEAFHASFGLPVVTLRPFNTFGPRQSARAVIPSLVAQCLSGSRVKLGNLTPTRDFTYVSDTVEGFIRAALTPAIEGATIHLGTGREISIHDLAFMVARLTGRDLQLEQDSGRLRPQESEVERLLSDNQKARTCLGWTPQVPLEEGLLRTIRWIQAHPETLGSGRHTL